MKTIFFQVLMGIVSNFERDDEEQLTYRKRADRVLKSALRILGENFFQFLAQKFQQGSWKEKEVCLYALSSVYSTIPSGHPAVSGFLELLPSICDNPSHDFLFVISCSTFIGKYSPWIQTPGVFSACLQFLLRNLSQSGQKLTNGSDCFSFPDASSAAGDALKTFCICCKNHVGPHLEEIVKVLIPFLEPSEGNESSRRSVISGICSAVYSATDATRGKNIIQAIATPMCNHVVQFAQTKNFEKLKEEISALSVIFHPEVSQETQITAIQVEVCHSICDPVFSLLVQVQSTFGGLDPVIVEELNEAICEVIHGFLEGTSDSVSPTILQNLISILTPAFVLPTSSGLKSVGSIIKYHMRTQEKLQIVVPLLSNVFGIMFEKMKQEHPNEILLEDFFGLLTKLLQNSADVLLASEGSLILSLVSASVHCLHHPFIELQKSVLTFLELLFFGAHTTQPNWQKILLDALHFQGTGVHLFTTLLQNLVQGSGHFKLIQLQSTFLHKFIFSPLRESSLNFLVESFKNPKSPFNTDIFTETDRENILKILAKTEQPRLFKMLIKDLAEVTNGLQTIDALGNYF